MRSYNINSFAPTCNLDGKNAAWWSVLVALSYKTGVRRLVVEEQPSESNPEYEERRLCWCLPGIGTVERVKEVMEEVKAPDNIGRVSHSSPVSPPTEKVVEAAITPSQRSAYEETVVSFMKSREGEADFAAASSISSLAKMLMEVRRVSFTDAFKRGEDATVGRSAEAVLNAVVRKKGMTSGDVTLANCLMEHCPKFKELFRTLVNMGMETEYKLEDGQEGGATLILDTPGSTSRGKKKPSKAASSSATTILCAHPQALHLTHAFLSAIQCHHTYLIGEGSSTNQQQNDQCGDFLLGQTSIQRYNERKGESRRRPRSSLPPANTHTLRVQDHALVGGHGRWPQRHAGGLDR